MLRKSWPSLSQRRGQVLVSHHKLSDGIFYSAKMVNPYRCIRANLLFILLDFFVIIHDCHKIAQRH